MSTQGHEPLTEKEILDGLARSKCGKSRGPDGIPIEIYKTSEVCKKLLIRLFQTTWDAEDVPAKFAQATFTMLYKNKGSPDDPSKYRCIGLLNHAYKVFAQCIHKRLEQQTAKFLSEWQAGFRSKRGCRDNVLVLRTLCDYILRQDKKLYATFIDYSAAFDTVSHRFIDVALTKSGATNKSRAIFRAVYGAATPRRKKYSYPGVCG